MSDIKDDSAMEALIVIIYIKRTIYINRESKLSLNEVSKVYLPFLFLLRFGRI